MSGLVLLSLFSTACAARPSQCVGFGQAVALGTVARADITEASGLVASRTQDDLLWTHNDSGGQPAIYGLGRDGRDRGSVTLLGADNVDWEDIAIGVGPTGDATIFIGDIGDNDNNRSSITVWRLAEPTAVDADQVVAGAAKLTLRWPEQPTNAEGLAVDPQTNLLLISTKEKRLVRLFQADAMAEAGSQQTLTQVGQIDLSDDVYQGGRRVTALDISPTGDRIFMRTHTQVLVFARPTGTSISDALAVGPCLTPAPSEPQGEALAALSNGFLTLSEGIAPTLWSVSAP
ncbi:MAG: hypothetical protein GXP62_10800 [Oligoflexia bacterium]|nr:hypothetical protein [Oligoflexia bacterium]